MRIWIALLCLACEDKMSFLRPMEVTSTPTEVSYATSNGWLRMGTTLWVCLPDP